jgi:hypothetical protein
MNNHEFQVGQGRKEDGGTLAEENREIKRLEMSKDLKAEY